MAFPVVVLEEEIAAAVKILPPERDTILTVPTAVDGTP
jgi:hypothetical protein